MADRLAELEWKADCLTSRADALTPGLGTSAYGVHYAEKPTSNVYRAEGLKDDGVPFIVNVMADSESAALSVAKTVHNLADPSITLIGK